LPPSFEGLDDGHAPAAAWTGREPIGWLRLLDRLWWRRLAKQFTGLRDAGLAGGTGEQAVMSDAVEPRRQDME
jgi:hypothetical protein